jgi:hypothetical protein
MTEHDLRFKLEYLSKKSLKLGLWFLIAFFSVLNGSAQETAKYRDPISNYKFGNALMDHSLYLPAKYEYERHMQQPDRPSFEKFDRLKTESILNSAIAGLRLNLPQGENELKSYIDQNYPNPIAIDAILELSSFYYNQKRYLDAVYYYDKLDINKLQGISKSEAAFKKGYSLFVQSKFKESLTAFKTSEEMDDMFYHPINYYSGMSYYFLNEYTNAVHRFEISSASPQYAPYIPYYTSQIYFSQKQYDKVISQGEKSILDQKTLNKKEIRQLLGQSYYAKNDFAKALPHLEYYEANTDKLTAEEFYQLAFTQYS